ncbi:Carbamoyl-phosphate synthase large chain [Sesbania bispinosa]|nr:Carbamoyl-phosphate synthase large chain [Sesbania bispinosa]
MLMHSYDNVVSGRIMEHIEQVVELPGDTVYSILRRTMPLTLNPKFLIQDNLAMTENLAKQHVCGHMNCHYAITASGEVFCLRPTLKLLILRQTSGTTHALE